MADTDKNILITPNTGTTSQPKIEFTGFENNTLTLNVLDSGAISIEGSSGQLFSIADSLTGTIFSVNDISGIPSIEVDDDGTVRLAEFSGNVLLGTSIDNGVDKLQVNGSVSATSFTGTVAWSNLSNVPDPVVTLTGAVTGTATMTNLGSISIATTATSDPVITLTGAVTGSGTMTNLGNVSIATTATADPTLTLTGDVTGSATFTNLGNATLTATVANDSHTHSTYLPLAGGTMTGNLNYRMLANQTTSNYDTAGDSSGFSVFYASNTATSKPTGTDHAVATFSFSDAWQAQIATDWRTKEMYFRTQENTAWKTWARMWHSDNDGSGSGLDADLIDGFHASQTSGSANTAVVRNASGYIMNTWFNSSRGDEATAAASYIYDTGDGYMRKKTLANARAEIVTASDILTKIKTVDGAGSGLDADTLDTYNSADFTKYSATGELSNALGPAAWVTSYSTAANVDHIWFDDATNTYYANADATFKNANASAIVAAATFKEGGTNLSAKYLGISAKAADSQLLDGIDSTAFVRSNADDDISGDINLTAALSYTQTNPTAAVHVIRPQGALYNTTTSVLTGYIKITLPVGYTNTMMSMWVDIYDYAGGSDGESISLYIGGYNAATPTWGNCFAKVISSREDRFYNVRFGDDGTGVCAIYIGESTSTWSYPNVCVRDFVGGHIGATSANWADGWDVGITVTLGTIYRTVTAGLSADYAVAASKWATGRTITLTGDVTGASAAWDGSGNISFATTVADNSHAHTIANVTGLQTALDGKLDENTGFIWTGVGGSALSFQSGGAIDSATGDLAALEVYQPTAGDDAFMQFHVAGDYAKYFGLHGGINDFVIGGWSHGASYQRIFHDGYHPNADTWTTGRTITLGGVLSGAVTINGSANVTLTAAHTSDPVITLTGAVTGTGTMTNLGSVSIATTATADPTLTLTGDVTGSATFTNLGNASLAATASSLDGVATNRFVYGTNANKTTNTANVNTALPSGFYDGSSATGSPTATWYTYVNARHNNTTNNYGAQWACSFYDTSNVYVRNIANNVYGAWAKIWNSTNDGSGSGLDADLLDGQQGTYYLDWANVTNKPDPVVTLTGAVTGSATMTDLGSISIATTATSDPVITLTGAVTGSGTMTNLGNVSIATTATADPTLTLTGDVTGSATFTNLGNASLVTTVANDSHTHSNYMLRSGTAQTAINSQFESSAYRFDPSTNNPTNEHYAVLTYGNQSNVVGQLATHFVSGATYNRAYNSAWSTWSRMFDDDYHPNADTLTTARNIGVTLTGDVTGSGTASFNGSSAVTISVATTGGGGTDLTALTDMTQTFLTTDEFVVLDSNAPRRKAASEIIADLDIVTGNVTGTLFADVISANQINANMIAANQITANLIAANQITANELEISSSASVANSIYFDGTNKRIDIKDAGGNLRVRIGQL